MYHFIWHILHGYFRVCVYVQDRLRNLIEQEVSKCSQTLFIFDEIDKMPAGLIDTIKPFLDYHEQLGGVDYRHAIFIFLRCEVLSEKSHIK